MTGGNAKKDFQACVQRYLDGDGKSVDYNQVATDIRDLMGAEYAVLHLSVSSNWFVIKGITGDPQQLEAASRVLRTDLLGKEWYFDQEQLDYLKPHTVARVPENHVRYNCLMPSVEAQKMMTLFKIRSVFVIPIFCGSTMKGIFTLLSTNPDYEPDRQAASMIMVFMRSMFLTWESEKEQTELRRILQEKLDEVQENQEELRRKAEEFRALAENSPDIITRYNRDFVRVFINPAIEKEMGFPVESLLGRSIYEGVMPSHVVQVLEEKLKACFDTGDPQENSMAIPTPRGMKHFQARFVPEFGVDGNVEFVLNVTRNVTERVEAEQSIRESEERFRMLAENPLDVVFSIEMKPEPHFTFISPSFFDVTGYLPHETSSTEQIIRDLLGEYMNEHYLARIRNSTSRKHSLELAIENRSGEKVWLEVVMSSTQDEAGTLQKMEGIARDITQRKQAEAEISHLTYHDILTGVYNRSFYELELKRLDVPRQLPLSIIMGDLNGLKLINDSLGHQEGDRILKATADILRGSCRQEDMICRWGGDEFAILLPQTDERAAEEVVQRILQRIALVNKTMNVPISLSVGTATKKDMNTGVEKVMKEAEDRMYRRKLLDSRSIRSSIIHSLLKSLEDRTGESREHTDRMRQNCLALGNALRLGNHELDNLVLLCAVHDVGKISIPDRILHKKGKLSKEEKQIMQSHSEFGYRIAQSAPDLAHIAHEILSHHEWWDGSGYPQGLTGEKIPMLARIISIVDAYEVMTGGRSYQDKKDARAAAQELISMSERQFDPDIVKVFVRDVLGFYDLVEPKTE